MYYVGMEYLVTTFYKFTPIPEAELSTYKEAIVQKANELSLVGLLLLAPEGVNATLCGNREAVGTYKEYLQELFGALVFKDSVCEKLPFKRFKVKIKPEIVQLQRTDLQPTGSEVHVSPEHWDEMVEKNDMLLIDVRNVYETKIGTFKNAVDPQTKTFSQFPAWLKQSGIPKSKNIGIFCTGGIRCEKAAVAMKEEGYDNVYQLDGGILNYLEKRPNQNFAGECFVFDHRAAVGQDLHPSRVYKLCANCGNAGSVDRACSVCADVYRTCEDCVAVLPVAYCSKDCRNRHQVPIEKA